MEIDDLESDFHHKKSDNNFIITNRSCFNKEINPKIIKAVHFIQLANQETQKQTKNTREKIITELEGAKERLLNLITMVDCASMEKSQIKFKSLTDSLISTITSESKSRKKLIHVNFLKKADHFSQSIKAFKNDLLKKKESCQKSQDIFIELLALKSKGFYVEENFQLGYGANNTVSTNIILQNQYILNFEKFFNINKYNFILSVKNNFNQNQDEGKKFELKNDFYKYFNSKFKIIFEFQLHIDNTVILSANMYQMEELVNTLLNTKIFASNFNQKSKYYYEIGSYLIFYFKYLLYKFLKIEISTLLKHYSNSFQYKGLSYIISKTSNEISVIANFFNQFQFTFKTAKISLDEYNNINKRKDFSSTTYQNINTSHVGKIIKIFINNLFYDIRMYFILKDFSNLITNNPMLYDIIEYGTLIKNISKTCNVLLRRALIEKVKESIIRKELYNIVITNYMNLKNGYFTTKFIITKKNVISSIYIKYVEFNIDFTHHGGIVFELKQPYPNQIYYIDKVNYSVQKYKRMDFNYLVDIIDNISL